MAGRAEGEAPSTLMDYLSLQGREWLLMVDESHVSLPQLRAMYFGDRARKERLVKHGYRLPSALDNRPLKEDEFWERVQQAVFISATPAKREINLSERDPVEMVIRPTHVCDPVIEVRVSLRTRLGLSCFSAGALAHYGALSCRSNHATGN